ncbi:unnamed protein product [Alopecurus aequalis]
MAGADRLSCLSDDLLASVISFLPTREAVRTAALSRRWRPVWHRTDSLILDSRSHGDRSEDLCAYRGRQDDGTKHRILSSSDEFLRATGRCNQVRKLSLSVHGRDKEYFEHFMGSSMWGASRGGYHLMASLLADPALRYLEVVRVKLEVINLGPGYQRRSSLTVGCTSWTLRNYREKPSEFWTSRSAGSSLRRTAPPSPSLTSPPYGFTKETWFAPFWQLLGCFRHVKAVRLKVPAIEGIAVDKDVQHEHLFTFPFLERLEVRGFSDPSRRDDAALAVANLLQCCPVIHDLRIRIPTDPYRAHYAGRRRKVLVPDFDASMDVFRRRFSGEMVPLMPDEEDGCSQAAVLPGLTGCRFCCLDEHLRTVTLQFELKELNSFEVCLARFFAENCMVLEALQIDDGKRTFLSHVNWMVERWRANALKQRKQMECDSV